MIVALTSLIAAAFLAATPLPMQSEAVFVALQGAGALPLPTMVVVAGLANTAGSVVTWALGRGLRRLEGRFAPPVDKLARAEAVYARWGRWSLLASWAPLGDVICLAAGMMRVPLWQFVAIVGVAKTARYAALAAATAGVLSLGWT